MATPKMTKNQMRRAKKKEQKKAAAAAEPATDKLEETPTDDATTTKDDHAVAAPTDEPSAAAEPVVTVESFDDEDPTFAMYKSIFDKFGVPQLGDDAIAKEANAGNTGTVMWDDDDDIPDEDEEAGQTKLSKKKRKLMSKLSVAELKALVKIPEVVEWQDTSSTDPRLLVQIKAQRNVVPVPTHWSLKREYLSSKRGVEKPPFRLPNFIAETGITEMRDAVLEKEAEQSLKQKQRARVQPKMGKLDIDYQKLYDAFFRFQEKPELTRFGEVYYEGKESEVDYQHFRTGELSDSTKEALGMPPGAPPPWLINQQRFGPPPSYPALKIPGLNAPPPPGGSWGFHPGGWGKPPVDEANKPLYGGDVFGLTGQGGAQQPDLTLTGGAEPAERTLWGELRPREEESEEEESDEEEDDDEDEDGDDAAGTETPSGLETPGGYASTIAPDHGIETSIAGEMDLRKNVRSGHDTEDSSAPRSAYTVLPERQVRASGFFGSDRAYDLKQGQSNNPTTANLPTLGEDDRRSKRKKPGDVDVALDPEALASADGISQEDVQRKFEQSRREEESGKGWRYDEDLSDMIAQESRKRQKTDGERREKRREGKR